jgi:hypothetical protein
VISIELCREMLITVRALKLTVAFDPALSSTSMSVIVRNEEVAG